MKSHAIEITTFKLKGCTMKQFIEANKDVDYFLKRQKGFRSRHMFLLKRDVVYDMLFWDTTHDGTAAMHRLMKELGNLPVHGMIDQNTVSWNIAPVEHFVNL
ncbi:MAG: hypothetical protein V4581_09630 [Bacteroidota bacterium]